MDALAFKNEILPCYSTMVALAFRMLGDRDDARDTVQDTMRRLWERHETIDIKAGAQAFCLTAVRNACLSHLRCHGKVAVADIENASALSDNSAPDLDMIAVQQADIVRRAVDMLSEQRRRILRMSLGGMSNKEIALSDGITEANVRQLLSRARSQIREAIDRYNGEHQ